MIVPAPSKLMLVLAIFYIFVQAAPHEPSLSSSSRELLKRGNTGSETGGTTIDEHDGDLEFSWLLENNIFEGLDIPELPPPPSLPLEAPLVGPPAPLNIINDPAFPVLPLAPAAPVAPLPPAAPVPVAAPIPQPVPPPATGNPDNKRKTAEDRKVIEPKRRTKSTGNDDSNPISSEKSDNSSKKKHDLHPTCNPFWQKYCGMCICYFTRKGAYTLTKCSNRSPFFSSLIEQFPSVVTSKMANYHCGDPEYGNCKCNGRQVELKVPPSYGPALEKIQAASLSPQAQS